MSLSRSGQPEPDVLYSLNLKLKGCKGMNHNNQYGWRQRVKGMKVELKLNKFVKIVDGTGRYEGKLLIKHWR